MIPDLAHLGTGLDHPSLQEVECTVEPHFSVPQHHKTSNHNGYDSWCHLFFFVVTPLYIWFEVHTLAEEKTSTLGILFYKWIDLLESIKSQRHQVFVIIINETVLLRYCCALFTE